MNCLLNKSVDPYFNLALEEYLFQLSDDQVYFWLWQNDNTIVIGRNQNALQEMDCAYTKRHGLTLARRITGGGAVYHDLGNINFSFVVPAAVGQIIHFKTFTDQIITALRAVGLHATYSGRNDLICNGRKFSGNAQLVGKHKVLHHGTLLFSSDLSVIGKCLTPSDEKLHVHGVRSVKSRVTNLLDCLPQKMSLQAFWDVLQSQICAGYENTCIRPLTEEEFSAVNHLRKQKFATDEWNYGDAAKLLPAGEVLCYDTTKSIRFEGCGTIRVQLKTDGSRMTACKITGDFFGNGDVSEIEAALTNRMATRGEIGKALQPFSIGHYFGNISTDDFLLLFADLTE